MSKRFFIIFAFTAAFICFLILCCTSGPSSGVNEISSDSATIAKGERLFVTHCSICHNFYHVGTGPQLAGLTTDTSVVWIKNFIRNPKKMIESGDERALRLFKTHKTVMPSFAYLPDEEIDAIIAFMHTRKKREKGVGMEDTGDVKNPIPDSIQTADLVVDVKLITQIPASSDQSPLARIIKLDYHPHTGDLFILDLRGRLYKLMNNQPKVYMDMHALNSAFVEKPGLATGFGSFAFHPSFKSNGLIYTTHTEIPGKIKADFIYADTIPVALQWVLTEWKTDPDAFPFSGKARELMRVNVPTGIHGVQEIAFHPESKPGDEDYGYLYIGVGDGGSVEVGVPLVSPVPDKIWGSIVRIDPLGKNSRNGKYGIPPTNPYYNQEKFVREVYAHGFRNPHRFSWDRDGQLLATNIGERHIEALYIILPGRFYGWPIREGRFVERFFDHTGYIFPLPTDDSVYQVTYPVAQFDHDEGSAIAGGFEYKGTAVPALKGKYVFGDIASGKLFFVNIRDLKGARPATIKKWNISLDGKPTTLPALCKNNRVELRFGMDKKGEIYLLTKADGKVYKLVK